MNIVVPIKLVPDLVEELEVDASGKDLDREWLKFKLNEFDDHALEEALLLKEAHGATVTAIALDGDDIDKPLYAAAAKDVDKVVKVTGDFGGSLTSHKAAKALANAIGTMGFDLVMTGVQAVDDRDGQVAVLLAHYLGVPHVSVVTAVEMEGDKTIVQKEYAGGVVAEFEVSGKVVLGIQAALETPRYVPVARIRRAQRGTEIEEVAAGDVAVGNGSEVSRMFKPETVGGAQMLDGSPEDMVNKIVNILNEKGIK